MAAKQKTKNPKKRKTGTAAPPPHGQPKDFDDFPPGSTPNTEIHKIRKAMTDMRKSLFDVGGVTANDYITIIRIQKLDSGTGVLSASCGCGCS